MVADPKEHKTHSLTRTELHWCRGDDGQRHRVVSVWRQRHAEATAKWLMEAKIPNSRPKAIDQMANRSQLDDTSFSASLDRVKAVDTVTGVANSSPHLKVCEEHDTLTTVPQRTTGDLSLL